MKSSRGSWDSSVTQLLKLKVSAGPVWLVLKVTIVLLAPASRPWKYCQGSGRGGTGSPYSTPSGTARPPRCRPRLGMVRLISVGTVCLSLSCSQNLAQLELSECALNRTAEIWNRAEP